MESLVSVVPTGVTSSTPLRRMIGLYRIADGTLLSVASMMPDPLPEGTASLALPEGGTVGVTHVWQTDPPAWVVRQTPTTMRLTRGDFMRRLGFLREVTLNMVQMDPNTPAQTKATIEALKAWLVRVDFVDVTDPITVQGVGIIGQILAGAGQLPEGQQAFADAMLALAPWEQSA